MKRLLGLLVVLMLVSGFAQAQTTLRLGHVVNEQANHHILAVNFKEALEQLSNGEITVEIFCCGQLGAGERELIELTQLGELDVFAGSTGALGGFVPRVNVFDLPFLFRDNAHVDAVLDGDIGRSILDEFESVGLKGLAFAENGWRNLTNNKRPVVDAEDAAGLKLRTMENQVHLDAWSQLGVNATPMSWGEVRNALQQGVIDGQENPVNIIHSFNLWEVQDYMSMTRHVFSPSVLLMNLDTFNSLSEEAQGWVLEAARQASRAERDWIRSNEEAMLNEISTHMEVEMSPDTQSFREAMTPVYAKYEDQFGWDLIEAIMSAGE
jgi:tripartite ATP-independent transporter DctP family solute receptor